MPAGSTIRTIAEVDRPGVRIAVAERTAYGLWLDRNIREAALVHAVGLDGSLKAFHDGGLEALAGLRPRLVTDVETIPGARLLEGRFMAVQQAVGTPRPKAAAIPWLQDFVTTAIRSGFVASRIAHHGVRGLSVAQDG